MKKYLYTTALSIIVPFSINNAQAQVIDYASMQDMFGEPVTTSANGSPQRSGNVALNMEILTAEDIKRSGARSIVEALRFVPGVDVRQHSFGQSEVGIRGYNQSGSERILVLVNGRQVYTDYFGQVVWDNIPVELIEIQQIEVVKGPNTALFGFNAVSGVINIVTDNPLMTESKEFSIRTGTHGLREGSAVINHRFTDDTAIKLSAGGYKTNSSFDDMDSILPTTNATRNAVSVDSERASIAIDLWSQLTDSIQGHLEFTRNTNDRNEVITTKAFGGVEYEATSARTGFIADTDYGMIEGDIYHNAVTTDYTFTVGPLTASNHITIAKLSDTFEVGNDHVFRVGGEYRNAANNFQSALAPLDQGDITYEIFSGSGLWDWRATDKLRTSAALRFDSFELSPKEGFVSPALVGSLTALGQAVPYTTADYFQKRKEISYNLGAVYKLDNINTFRVATARGADLPSFTEFALQFLGTDADGDPFDPTSNASALLGDPNVDTSIVTNYEIGYDRKIPEIDGLFRAAIFYQESDKMQSFTGLFVPGFALDQSILTNIGDSKMHGLEIGLEGIYEDNWNWMVNYTYVDIDDDLRNSQNPSFAFSAPTNYEDSVSNHTFNAGLGYTAESWRGNIFGQYKSSFDDLLSVTGQNGAQTLNKVDAQFIVNANVAYDLSDNISWHLSGSNIAGQTKQYVDGNAESVVWSGIDISF